MEFPSLSIAMSLLYDPAVLAFFINLRRKFAHSGDHPSQLTYVL